MRSRDRRIASLALAVAWGCLAAIVGAYAVARESVGALVLAVAVLWLMHLAWAAAWEPDDRPERPERPDAPFRF
jgi:hypothetical protein